MAGAEPSTSGGAGATCSPGHTSSALATSVIAQAQVLNLFRNATGQNATLVVRRRRARRVPGAVAREVGRRVVGDELTAALEHAP